METPKVSYTNVNAADFQNQIKEAKTDGKNNAIAVDKETGNVEVYTFDQKIPDDFKKGIEAQAVVFYDEGSDDQNVSDTEINKFAAAIRQAGTKFDPTPFINDLYKKVQDLKFKVDDNIGIKNVSRYLNQQVDNLWFALENHDTESIGKSNKILNSAVKQLAFGKVYVPEDQTFHRLNRNQLQLAGQLREITYIADMIKQRLEE